MRTKTCHWCVVVLPFRNVLVEGHPVVPRSELSEAQEAVDVSQGVDDRCSCKHPSIFGANERDSLACVCRAIPDEVGLVKNDAVPLHAGENPAMVLKPGNPLVIFDIRRD